MENHNNDRFAGRAGGMGKAGKPMSEDERLTDMEDSAQDVVNREAFLAAKHGGRNIRSNQGESRAPANENMEPEYQDDEVLGAQERLLSSLVIRLLFGVGITILLVWLDTAATFRYMLPDFISLSGHPLNFVLANLALLLILGGLCFSLLRTGVISLFTFRGDADSLTALAFLAAMVNLIFLLPNYSLLAHGSVMVFTSAAALCLIFNILSKVFFVRRVILNIRYAAGSNSFYALHGIDNYDTAMSLSKGLNTDSPYVCAAGKARVLTDFINNAYAFGKSDRAARIMAPAALISALFFGAADYLIKRDAAEAVACFTTICCVCAPVMFGAGEAIPMYRICRRLIRHKAMLVGSDAVSAFYDVNVVIVKDNLIFPDNAVAVRGVKTYSGYKIENAILNAASIVYVTNGPLAPAFMTVIENARTSMLKQVENITYEDEMGVSCWIENRRILLGSRELMRKYGIFAPSRDYEAKYLSEGNDVLYLSEAGELCAMFIVEYMADKQVVAAARKLKHTGISLLVDTTDPNINPTLLSDKLGLSHGWAKVLGTSERELLKTAVPDNDWSCEAGIAFTGGFRSYVDALTAAVRVRSTVGVCTVLQIVGMVLGILLMVYMTFLSGITEVNPVQIMAYQALWALPVLLIACFRRH